MTRVSGFAKQAAVLDLPKAARVRRQWLADQIASCVLIEPSLCPSREHLPRDGLACADLRAVLALSLTTRDPVRLSRRVLRERGREYVRRLATVLTAQPHSRDELFVWQLGWYVHQLRELNDVAQQHDAALRELAKMRKAASICARHR